MALLFLIISMSSNLIRHNMLRISCSVWYFLSREREENVTVKNFPSHAYQNQILIMKSWDGNVSHIPGHWWQDIHRSLADSPNKGPVMRGFDVIWLVRLYTLWRRQWNERLIKNHVEFILKMGRGWCTKAQRIANKTLACLFIFQWELTSCNPNIKPVFEDWSLNKICRMNL